MKKFIVIVLAMLLVFSVLGCGVSPDTTPTNESKETVSTTTTSETSAKQEKYTIGYSVMTLSSQYMATLKNYLIERRDQLGLKDQVEIIVLDAQYEAAKQNSQVDNLITQGVDCIIMSPLDIEQQVPAVEAAATAGIPLIELCSSTKSDKKLSYVGSDDIQSGLMLGEQLLKSSKDPGKIVVLHGNIGTNAEIMRHKGLEQVIAEKYPNAKIVADKACEWDRAKSIAALENIIQSGIDFNMVFAECDEMAMGALVACEAAGRKDVMIGGIDAIPDALQAVKDGRLSCTVLQNVKEQGYKAFDVALQVCRGEKIDKLYDIPYELITPENINDYLK